MDKKHYKVLKFYNSPRSGRVQESRLKAADDWVRDCLTFSLKTLTASLRLGLRLNLALRLSRYGESCKNYNILLSSLSIIRVNISINRYNNILNAVTIVAN